MKALLVFCGFLLLLLGGALPAHSGFGASQVATVAHAKSNMPALLCSNATGSASETGIVGNAADDEDEDGNSGPPSEFHTDPTIPALSAHDSYFRVGSPVASHASFAGKPRYIGLCSLRI